MEGGVSGWYESSRGESNESMDMDMGLVSCVEVCAGQMVATSSVVELVVAGVERSKTVEGASPGYFWR